MFKGYVFSIFKYEVKLWTLKILKIKNESFELWNLMWIGKIRLRKTKLSFEPGCELLNSKGPSAGYMKNWCKTQTEQRKTTPDGHPESEMHNLYLHEQK